MTNCQNKDNYLLILNITQNPVISNTISPKPGMVALQWFSKMPGIFTSLNPVIEPVENAFLNLTVEFPKLPFGNVADFNGPGQFLFSFVSVIYWLS